MKLYNIFLIINNKKKKKLKSLELLYLNQTKTFPIVVIEKDRGTRDKMLRV